MSNGTGTPAVTYISKWWKISWFQPQYWNILKCTTKLYTLFTDASKYSWAGVLTQENTSVIDGKEVTTNHPVSFVSGLFHGSQLNWAAMTKEAYAIYTTVKKSMFYLTGQEITQKWSFTFQEIP